MTFSETFYFYTTSLNKTIENEGADTFLLKRKYEFHVVWFLVLIDLYVGNFNFITIFHNKIVSC